MIGRVYGFVNRRPLTCLSAFVEAIKSLPPTINDGFYLQCRFLALMSRTACSLLDASSAVTYWKEAVSVLRSCSSKGEWVAVETADAPNVIQRRLETLAAASVDILCSICSHVRFLWLSMFVRAVFVCVIC